MSAPPVQPCSPRDHDRPAMAAVDLASPAYDRAGAIFAALGEPGRLRILGLLLVQPLCVGQIARTLGDNMAAISQRLKLLRSERIVSRSRQGKHVIYALDDEHVARLVRNGLAHAGEAIR